MTVTVNIHEEKTHLSRSVESAAKDQEFMIAKAGKPMVRVMPINRCRLFVLWASWPAKGWWRLM